MHAQRRLSWRHHWGRPCTADRMCGSSPFLLWLVAYCTFSTPPCSATKEVVLTSLGSTCRFVSIDKAELSWRKVSDCRSKFSFRHAVYVDSLAIKQCVFEWPTEVALLVSFLVRLLVLLLFQRTHKKLKKKSQSTKTSYRHDNRKLRKRKSTEAVRVRSRLWIALTIKRSRYGKTAAKTHDGEIQNHQPWSPRHTNNHNTRPWMVGMLL